MVLRWIKHSRCAIFIVGMVLVLGMAILPCYAGGAATIIPDQRQLAPRGSYIPEHRVERVMKKIKEHKATMKQRDAIKKDKQLQESETPAPQSSKEKE